MSGLTPLSGEVARKPPARQGAGPVAIFLLTAAHGVNTMRALSLPLVAVLALGCERSAVNATDAITVKGTLQDAAGAPKAGATVKLYRGPPRTSGGLCPLLTGTPWKTQTSAADGSYSFLFTGRDSQTDDIFGYGEGGDLARCFRLASEGAAEASVSADFTVQLTTVEAPLLRDYDAALAVASGAGTAEFSWSAPSAGAAPLSYVLNVSTESGESLWSAASSGGTTSASLPDYAFEGLASTARLVARTEERVSGTIWPVRLESASLAVAARGAAPLSRGAACDLASPCPLTDGSFKPVTVDREAVTITLPNPLPLKHLVVRGLVGTGDRLVAESSVDGTTFTSLADVSYAGSLHDFEAASVQAVRAVRLKLVKTSSSNSTPRISFLAELSIFP